ncbi:MAG: hypothetical protein MZU97_10645 [Bacillus subtilis]|nr:hypothetical protein [Bacillus subtilis]
MNKSGIFGVVLSDLNNTFYTYILREMFPKSKKRSIVCSWSFRRRRDHRARQYRKTRCIAGRNHRLHTRPATREGDRKHIFFETASPHCSSIDARMIKSIL